MKTRTGGAVPIMNQYDTCQLVQKWFLVCWEGLIVLILSTVNYHDYTPSVGTSSVGRRTEKVEGSWVMCLLPDEFVFWGRYLADYPMVSTINMLLCVYYRSRSA